VLCWLRVLPSSPRKSRITRRRGVPRFAFNLGCLLVVLATSAQGGVLYEFAFTPTTGAIQPFTFSFTSGAFVGDGPLTFPSFPITDGTNTWTMTAGHAVDIGNQYCFVFGTTSNVVLGCGYNVGFPGSGAVFLEFQGATLPTDYGVYTTMPKQQFFAGAIAIGTSMGGQTSGSTGTAVLTISERGTAIPEPSTCALLSIGLIWLLATRRKPFSGF